jgi:hypothetical protein
MAAAQSYANHVRRPRLWNAAFVLAVAALALLITDASKPASGGSPALAGLGAAVVMGLSALRISATRLQDRIIRLEMQVRLSRLGRAADVARLSTRQLIALRFASDAELPALLDRTLTEQLTPDAIKRAVTDWQADSIRV